ncbi:MAG: dihydropteroate synthase [Candidatus Thiodiazotropha lotti]|uniref:dihydropteroate synthase n=1 Tax=Candidatus Thiodiazotropha endoloripes TaxID=1818881 RepID=UPI00083DCD6F|nr:dihydropteroate synthase [Candidatus Thiodiazotropha endoloripes]MCG7912271.1 dihydropteroate synthase [Candidatus Thiodiazotropha weberae]MCG7998755.1 dihydropteroate synthase [Candidatus Thiodiazotropha lotti]MCW4190521.1 dihydropteroate synthase [Candidatus Thiodiazotropha weberae]ODB83406.1 dihydropteroate synthase [Candidatus Thiodiazotropha endoloripes]ODB91015.1 dihydropteroate synthase [Candidatus Thiodiazotropha endoloripes]
MSAPKILDCAGKTLDLSQPQVMGILNLTPDSFSDGGRFTARDAAIKHAMQMIDEGAAIIDVGGESTRPGAQPVTAQQEMDRVIPLIETLAGEIPLPISVDTSKAEVMREAVSAGAGMINDVMALRDSGALEAAAEAAVPVCLMHMQGEPRTMQCNPHYDDVVDDVKTFLQQRLDACVASGIPQDRLIVDPGFGFGKTLPHNLALLDGLQNLEQLGVPLLVGISRKSMIGALLGERAVEERLYGSLAAAVMAAMKGSAILRVHDVQATVDALKIVSAVQAVNPVIK